MASREPFSRHDAAGGSDERTPDERLIAAYEFVAAEYGWKPQEVEEELSDEQLVAYLDAAIDRIGDKQRAEFDGQVEAIRAGTIFAHDAKAYGRWHRSAAPKGKGLTGEGLEQAVMQLKARAPEYVVMGPG